MNRLLCYGYLQTAGMHRRAGNLTVAQEWLGRARRVEAEPSAHVALSLEAAAVEVGSTPEVGLERLRTLRDSTHMQAASALESTFFYYLSALGALMAGRSDEALDSFEDACAHAAKLGSEQVLAAELNYDRRLLDLAGGSQPEDPIISSLRSRIEFMRLFAGQYQADDGTTNLAEMELNALGESLVERHGVPVGGLAPLPRLLLFFLADRKAVKRDIILEAFWPEVIVDKQVSSLYTAVHSLRERLGKDVIATGGPLYRLNPKWEMRFDVADFERAADVAEDVPVGDARRVLALSQAISAYGGPFLPEYDQDWVLTRRRDLASRYLRLLVEHATAAQAKGQENEALSSLRQALILEPLREDINLKYLQILARLGRRTEAIRHYHTVKQMLSDELGIEPSAELRSFYSSLVR